MVAEMLTGTQKVQNISKMSGEYKGTLANFNRISATMQNHGQKIKKKIVVYTSGIHERWKNSLIL